MFNSKFLDTLQRKLLLAVACAGLAGVVSAQASIIGATYTSGSAGSLNGDSFTVSGSPTTTSIDLSGSSYGSYALSSSQQVLVLYGSESYTITFTDAVTDLLVYDVYFRGATYTFDAASTIVAGNTNVTYSGDNITTPGGFATYTSGVLDFAGPITSLTIVDGSSGTVGLTFGIDTGAATPEPASFVLVPTAALAAVLLRRRLQPVN